MMYNETVEVIKKVKFFPESTTSKFGGVVVLDKEALEDFAYDYLKLWWEKKKAENPAKAEKTLVFYGNITEEEMLQKDAANFIKEFENYLQHSEVAGNANLYSLLFEGEGNNVYFYFEFDQDCLETYFPDTVYQEILFQELKPVLEENILNNLREMGLEK